MKAHVMKPMVLMVLMLVFGGAAAILHAQTERANPANPSSPSSPSSPSTPSSPSRPSGPSSLSELRNRYDVVALQRGVALVPRQPRSAIRMIEVVDGVVSIDGEALTGRQLTEKLGADAPLVLQVSYLSPAAQRDLAGAAASSTTTDPAIGAPSDRAATDAVQPGDTVTRSQIRNGDIVRFGSSVTVARDERIIGDVVTIGGSADVDGEVTGEIAVIGGSLTLGPNAIVRRDVAVIGGSLTRAPGAQVLGKIDEVGVGNGRGANSGVNTTINRRIRERIIPGLFGSFWSRAGSLAATTLRVTLLILLALAAVALMRTPVERIAARIAVSPVRSGLIGLLAEILFVPVLVLTVVVLAVSIVGIPLLALVPFAIVLVVLLMLMGFIGLAYQVGRFLTGRFGWPERGAYGAVTIGVLAIAAMTIVGRLVSLAGGFFLGAPLAAVGYLVEYVAWTIGFGATILTWFEAQRGTRTTVTAAPASVPGEA